MFVLSYQLKTRRGIIFFNAGSRVLYVLQYLLLGAFEGAVLDVVALLVSVLAQKKENGILSKHPKTTVIGANLFILIVGLMFYQNVFSLLPVAGVLFETGALWLNEEKQIRFDLVMDYDEKKREQIFQDIVVKISEKYPDYNIYPVLDADITDI
jgi:hypothetical protein